MLDLDQSSKSYGLKKGKSDNSSVTSENIAGTLYTGKIPEHTVWEQRGFQ